MMKNTKKTTKSEITYKDSGVDIDEGNKLITNIAQITETTSNEGSIGELGGFGGLFDLKKFRFKDPILVSSTDGVGTKLQLAIKTKSYFNVGIDLVAMCANDVLAQGAQPLFFMDYYATGKLNKSVAIEVINGIAEGCKQSGCALIGGETAEMPGHYKKNDFDVVVLDDGFQDYSIKKNLNIICFHSNQSIGNGLVLPSGPLRESLGSLSKAHIVIINGNKNDILEKKILDISNNIKIYYSKYLPSNIEQFKKLIFILNARSKNNKRVP